MKFIPMFFLIMFVVFALLQYNDPDPVQWMFAYLSAAFLSFLAFKGKLVNYIAFIAAGIYLVAAFYQWPPQYDGLTGNMDADPNIELGRESLGLIICAVVTLINFFISQKIKKA
ncbi:MAG TPA: transmembrane 220 family protein [Bacteroidia bacterium]|nr:transmembrane 220 family protein [Bacteroidia bacterium]